MEINWPETKEAYAQIFPKTVEKFWDQERIDALH